MPVLRSITVYHRLDGRRHRIRLYKSWRNMRDRIAGHIRTGRGGMPIWLGLETDFMSWADFRQWALSHGFSKRRCSLDRRDSRIGYMRHNCRWVTVLENSTFANLIGAKKRKQLAARMRQPITGAKAA